MATLLVIILIPVSLGMWLRCATPGFASSAERYVSLFGLLVLTALVVAIVMQMRDQLGLLLQTAGLAVVLLNLGGIAIGFLGGRFGGLSPVDALTVAIELGIKNATLGLLVTLTLLESSEMSVPSAVYGVLMFAFGVALIVFGRTRARRIA